MKVLVATRETQGSREGDYAWTVDGELVFAGGLSECSSPEGREQCGCGRGFAGLASHRATTTAEVVDRPGIDARALATAIRDSLHGQGWLVGLVRREIVEWVDDEVRRIEMVTSSFPVGTVIEREGASIAPRPLAA